MTKFPFLPVLGAVLLSSCSEKKEARLPDLRDEEITVLEIELAKLKAQMESERQSHQAQSTANALVMSELKELLVELNSKQQAVPPAPAPVAIPLTVDDTLEKALRERAAGALRTTRLLAQGEEHDSIETNLGDIYFDAVINYVSDIGVAIRHRGGAARVPFEELPTSWQERFGYDAKSAASALEREHLAQAKYQKTVSKELLAQREKNALLDKELREARLALTIAEANKPVLQRTTIVDNTPNLIPVGRTIITDPYCPDIIDQPIIRVPVIRNNGQSTQTAYPLRPVGGTHQPQRPSIPVVTPPPVQNTPLRPMAQRPTISPSASRMPSISSGSSSQPSPPSRAEPTSRPALQRSR